VSNYEHTIESGGYEYNVRPLQGMGGISTTALAFYVHFAKAYEEAITTWEEKIKDEGIKYADGYYPYSMVLGVVGIPCALIGSVDDIVQVFEITTSKKVEED